LRVQELAGQPCSTLLRAQRIGGGDKAAEEEPGSTEEPDAPNDINSMNTGCSTRQSPPVVILGSPA
jgi:hypothetical protein